MMEYVQNQFSHFEWDDLNPIKELPDALYRFSVWALPVFIFVLWSNKYYPHVEFYQEAISEGIGPNLWNLIGAFGGFAFSVAIVLSKYIFPAKAARQILLNTYAIGSLTFGILLGQWYLILNTSEIIWWHRGLFGITTGPLLVIVFVLNFAVWYLGFLIRNDSNGKSMFLIKLEQMNYFWRLGFGLFMGLMIAVIFLNA